MAFRGRKRVNRRRGRVKATSKASALTVSQLGKMMKTIALRQAETKVSSDTAENLQLTHNGTYFKGGFFGTTQGTQNPEGLGQAQRNRIGDEIVARGLKLKWWVSNKPDRPNVMYNIYVFYYNTLDTLTNSVFWRGTDGQGAIMNRMLDNPNPERIKVLKKISVKSKEQYVQDNLIPPDGLEHSYFRECWISFNNKKVTYRRDASTVPRGWDVGFAVVPYDAWGTLTTDRIASFAWSSTFYYKDP